MYDILGKALESLGDILEGSYKIKFFFSLLSHNNLTPFIFYILSSESAAFTDDLDYDAYFSLILIFFCFSVSIGYGGYLNRDIKLIEIGIIKLGGDIV